MSIETARTGKPSRFLNDEGWQGRTRQPLESAQRSGGVSGDGMLERADGVTREACPRAEQSATPSTTLLTNKSHHITGKNNIKPLITRMNADTSKWARVHSLREWGRVKQKLCKQACKIFAFSCQSQIDGIIRAHLRNPWLVLLQPRPARGLLETGKAEAARAGVGVLHSSEEVPENGVERRQGSSADACEAERERGDGPQGITTPTVPETATGVWKLQRTLYRQAKGKPKWKAWSLYGDVCRREVLETALWQVIANGGAPGVDGIKVEGLAEDGGHRELWLAKLETELRGKTYRPSPVRRVYIPKADGKKRPLGIPTVRDRVVQTAVVHLLLPIFEADFHENSFAYRPKRRVQQAIDAIKIALLSGRREVVDADLSGYFDTIPHAGLMRLVKGRVSDGSILKLIKGWLRSPIVEEDPETGVKRTVKNRCGRRSGRRLPGAPCGRKPMRSSPASIAG